MRWGKGRGKWAQEVEVEDEIKEEVEENEDEQGEEMLVMKEKGQEGEDERNWNGRSPRRWRLAAMRVEPASIAGGGWLRVGRDIV